MDEDSETYSNYETQGQQYDRNAGTPHLDNEDYKTFILSSTGFQATQMPIKVKLQTLEWNVNDQRMQLHENKKQAQILRSDCLSLEHKNKEVCNDMVKLIMEDVFNLDKEFKKGCHLDTAESNFLKKQTNDLISLKILLEQNMLMLAGRVAELEHEVGYE